MILRSDCRVAFAFGATLAVAQNAKATRQSECKIIYQNAKSSTKTNLKPIQRGQPQGLPLQIQNPYKISVERGETNKQYIVV